jgi:hypothetical protein
MLPCLCIVPAVLTGGVLAALPLLAAWVMWFIKREGSVFIDDHGRESMNFQLTLLIYAVLALIPSLMSCGAGFFVLYPGLGALAIAGAILGTRAAYQGKVYRYPVTLRFIKPGM